MRNPITPPGSKSPPLALPPAASTPPQTLEELLAEVVTAITHKPDDLDLPGGERTLPFFRQLLADHRARLVPEVVSADEPFWAHIGELSAPIPETWRAWKSDPSDATRVAIEHAVMVFWVGLGALSFDVVTRSLSPQTVAIWQGDNWLPAPIDPARAQYFALPRLPADIFSQVRAGELRGGNQLGPCAPAFYQSGTFAIPEQWPNARYWRIRSPQGVQTALPLTGSDVPQNLGSRGRDVLSGGVLRLWLATWVLSAERGDPRGIFEVDPKHVICDLYGRKPEVTIAPNGRRYERAPRSMERELERHLEVLKNIYVYSVGSMAAEVPEPLIRRYTDTATQDDFYMHASLAWLCAGMDFTQVPRAVLQLDSVIAPLALGVANLWRARITSVLKGSGRYVTALRDLAAEVGEDFRASAQRHGRVYWGMLIERLERVLKAGDLGTLVVEGEGPTASVTLEPSSTLRTVYQPLADASDRKRELTRKTEFEVTVRKLLASETRSRSSRKNRG